MLEDILGQVIAAAIPAILNSLSQHPVAQQTTVTAAADVIGSLKQTTSGSKPSEFVRWIQHAVNTYGSPAVPLKEDGWLGPKTEAAVAALAAPYGFIIPIDA